MGASKKLIGSGQHLSCPPQATLDAIRILCPMEEAGSRTYQQVAVHDADGNVNMCAVLSKIDVVISDRDGEVSFRYVAPALAHLYSNPAIRAKVPDPYWGFIRNRLQTLEGRLLHSSSRSPRVAPATWALQAFQRLEPVAIRPYIELMLRIPGHSLDRRRLSASSDAPS